jgi:hypothetical protein
MFSLSASEQFSGKASALVWGAICVAVELELKSPKAPLFGEYLPIVFADIATIGPKELVHSLPTNSKALANFHGDFYGLVLVLLGVDLRYIESAVAQYYTGCVDAELFADFGRGRVSQLVWVPVL